MAYHARLEMAFLMDEFALPPARPEESELLMAGSPGNSPLTEIPQKELPKISSKQVWLVNLQNVCALELKLVSK